jgi:hypothetical protein
MLNPSPHRDVVRRHAPLPQEFFEIPIGKGKAQVLTHRHQRAVFRHLTTLPAFDAPRLQHNRLKWRTPEAEKLRPIRHNIGQGRI